MDDKLIIFAKAPVAGLAKTRLFPHLSYEEAAEVQRAFIADTIEKALSLAAVNVCVAYTPEEALREIKELCGGRVTEYVPQEGRDLGERMARAFDRAFSNGAKGAAILGTDIPALPASYIRDAFGRLSCADMVLGPATDGGYYLIALRKPEPRLFDGIAWSSRSVFEETMARASRLGLRADCLPPLDDVDTFEDLKGLIDVPLPPNTGRLMASIEAKLRSRARRHA